MAHAFAATDLAAAPRGTAPIPLLRRSVPHGLLAATLVGWLGLDQILLWRFLGLHSPWLYASGAAVIAGLLALAPHAVREAGGGPSIGTLLVCLAVAAGLYALGGEGRLFYANTDWRVRDGVLHDMAVHPWPYAYLARGLPELLRAPIGMYLVPALAMKAGGQAAGDWTLLAQNSLLLTLLLGLASPLFDGARARLVALGVFVMFSGLDFVGALLMDGPRHIPDHLEWWSELQFSSHVTQAFWVPQHALAGWIAAAAYLLWRERRLPLAALLSLAPLLPLWSPLAVIGALPLMALAAVEALLTRRLRWADLAAPLATLALAGPSVLYLGAAAGSVRVAAPGPRPADYVMFEALEVLPFLLLAATMRRGRRFGRATLAVVGATLLLLPIERGGLPADLVMRGSIPALAILAVMMADGLLTEPPGRRALIAILLAGGSVTGLHEIRRALVLPPVSPPLCSFFGAWGPGDPALKSTYLAPVERLPAPIRPLVVTLVPAGDPPRCWAKPWPVPSGVPI